MPCFQGHEKGANGSVAICPGVKGLNTSHWRRACLLSMRICDFASHGDELELVVVTRQARAYAANMQALSVNGNHYEVDVEPDTPLLWVLRDTIGLTGTKFGCGIAECGACTVHIDGIATRSCQIQIGSLGSKRVTTIEALAQNGELHPLQRAGVEHDVPQCGYCQSGMLMAARHCSRKSPSRPTPTSTPQSRISAAAEPTSGSVPRSTRRPTKS